MRGNLLTLCYCICQFSNLLARSKIRTYKNGNLKKNFIASPKSDTRWQQSDVLIKFQELWICQLSITLSSGTCRVINWSVYCTSLTNRYPNLGNTRFINDRSSVLRISLNMSTCAELPKPQRGKNEHFILVSSFN